MTETAHVVEAVEDRDSAGRGWRTAWIWRCSCGAESWSAWRTKTEALAGATAAGAEPHPDATLEGTA